jgi:hypothetical protein
MPKKGKTRPSCASSTLAQRSSRSWRDMLSVTGSDDT